MLRVQILREIITDHLLGQVESLKEGLERLFAELAIGTIDVGQFAYFGIDEALADSNSMFFAKCRQGITIDQAVQRAVKAAALDEFGHIKRWIVTALGTKAVVEQVLEFTKANALFAHLGYMALAQPAKAAGTSNVAQGKGKADEHDEGEGEHGTPA